MATYLVEAVDTYGEDLLYILKSKREAVAAAKIEAENQRVSGGNGPKFIEVSKWNYVTQEREGVGKVRI